MDREKKKELMLAELDRITDELNRSSQAAYTDFLTMMTPSLVGLDGAKGPTVFDMLKMLDKEIERITELLGGTVLAEDCADGLEEAMSTMKNLAKLESALKRTARVTEAVFLATSGEHVSVTVQINREH